jgi:hypothetical protein
VQGYATHVRRTVQGEIMPEPEHERWLTYAELGKLLGITPPAARMHAKRRGWPRRSPNAIGARATVLLPADAVVHPRATAVQRTFTPVCDERAERV